jgi:hypothetical protein
MDQFVSYEENEVLWIRPQNLYLRTFILSKMVQGIFKVNLLTQALLASSGSLVGRTIDP